MKTVTPLLNFLRAMTAEQKNQFAKDVTEARRKLAFAAGHPESSIRPVTKLYLTQMACMDGTPNPGLLTAMPLVLMTQKWAPLIGMPALSYEDLLVPTVDDGGSD